MTSGGDHAHSFGRVLVRVLPVVLLTAAAMAYAVHVQGADAYPLRNIVPMMIVVLLAGFVLYRGGGRWTGRGLCWPLGVIGYAIPAVGLSLYLHYGYAADRDGMFSEAVYPKEVFRFLPAYTIFAGAIGFAIGWIVGRNAER